LNDNETVLGGPRATGLRGVMFGQLARQLGRPSGAFGRLAMGTMLNRHNGATVTAAVDALRPNESDVVADIGFGGGLGLSLLLDRVGPTGQVFGVDISTAMLRRAARRFRTDRLRLLAGSITALPLDTASVNGISCVNTVYFVADLPTAFGELARVIAPAGRLVLGVADPHVMAATPVTPFGFRLRPIEVLVTGLRTAGLPVVEHRRVGTGPDAFHLLIAERL
jgi:arsenite methyltransferase